MTGGPCACPRCGRAAVRYPAAYPADLIGKEVQEWDCDHCGAPLLRMMVPGMAAEDRGWVERAA